VGKARQGKIRQVMQVELVRRVGVSQAVYMVRRRSWERRWGVLGNGQTSTGRGL
jgi:hypothetical protein